MKTQKILSLSSLLFIFTLFFPYQLLAATPTISKNQLATNQSITLAQAKVMAQAAENMAHEINVPMVIAIIDQYGNLVLHERMENALLVSVDVSYKKAYSAIALKMPTDQLAKITTPGEELYGIQHSDNKLITFGGGFPIIVDGKMVGAIGISGGSVADDMKVAQAGLKALTD